MILKDPIRVVCVNVGKSKTLVKGVSYSAIKLRTHQYYSGSSRTIEIDEIDKKYTNNFTSKYFTLPDGTSLDDTPDFELEEEIIQIVDCTNDYVGKYVRCVSSIDFLIKNEIYYVEQQLVDNKNSWGSSNFSSFFKFRGIKKKFRVNYDFAEVSIKEARKIKLKNLNGDNFKTGENIRIFLSYTEKERIALLFEILSDLLKVLSKTGFDNNFNLVEMIMSKGSKYQIIEEDITPFLESDMFTLLNKFKYE